MALNKIKEWQLDLTNINAKIDAMDSSALRQDLDELGDQVSEIEAKIPGTTTDTNQLVNKQQLLDEEMDLREDMMQSDSELQQQINALADAIQGGGAGPAEGTYTKDNLLGGKGVSIEEEIQGAGQIDSDTMLMLHLDGNFEDSSEYASSNVINSISETEVFTEAKFAQGWKYSGSSTYNSKYYTNASLFSGIDKVTVDYITLAGSSVTTPSYVRLNTLSTGTTSSAYIYVYGTKTIVAYVNGKSYNISLTAEEIGQYPLVSYEASEGKVVFFINGKVVKVVEDASFKFGTGIQSFQISVANNQTSLLDEIRISKTLRYNGKDFTPLTQPYSPAMKTGRSLINNTAGKNIGEVFYSQSNSASDNVGALPLFTGETIANADALYPEFFSWVSSHSELQTTAEAYESALTTYGECPKYVLSAGSLRLPKLANYIKMANTAEGITQKEAGLPNITGSVSGVRAGAWAVDGAFANTEHTSTTSQTMTNHYNQADLTISLDASKSSAVYGKSNSVTPAHTTLYPWVYAYNAAIAASTAQAAEFQNALSGKADNNLGNVTEAGKVSSVSWIMPDFSRAIATGLAGKPTSETTTSYTCPTDGWLKLYATRGDMDGNTLFFVHNGATRFRFPAFVKSFATLMFPVSKSDVISLKTDLTSGTWDVSQCFFIPCKGV